MDYSELVKKLRNYASFTALPPLSDDLTKAANAIEELLKAAKAMHTWIFLNTGDEQKAYDECHLSDEMNAALGYGGQFIVAIPKEEQDGT